MDEAKVTSAILKHIENNFDTTELDGWSVEFEGIEDDDGSVFYVIWDYPSKSISEFNEG